jgi:hypothetical protein
VHYPPVKATTIWAATRCATVSRSLPTDCPSWEHKSVLLNYSNLLHTGQHSTLPTLTMHLTQHYESDRILMAHVRARVTCLQLSVWGKCGSLHGQLERENTCCAVLFWLFLQNTCLVFLDQHIILIPTGTYFDTHFHTHTHTYTHCVLLHALDYGQVHGFLLQRHDTVEVFHEEQCTCLVIRGQHNIICALQLVVTSSHDTTPVPSAGKWKTSDSNRLTAQCHKIASRLYQSVSMLENVLLCHLLIKVRTIRTTNTERSGKGSHTQWTTWQRAATHNWAFWLPFEQDNYGLCSTNTQSTTQLILTAGLS